MSDVHRLSCGTSREELHALHDGALAPDRAAALRAHAAVCDACGAELRFLATVAEGLSAAEAVPAEAWPAIAARLDERAGRTPARRTLAWAGVALALAVASAWMIAGRGNGAATEDPFATVLGNGSTSAEVTKAATLSYALGGPLAEASDAPDVDEEQP